jgi:hypothetical protein
MVIGGISNKSFGNRVEALRYDLKAIRNNNIFYQVSLYYLSLCVK